MKIASNNRLLVGTAEILDRSELFATLVAFIVVLGLSILLIARMRASNR